MKVLSRAVRIVLVRPRNPLNLLAAARAAANFGFEDIAVVSPHQPVWAEARAAPGAKLWLRHVRLAATLPEAIEDRNWVLGTSCLARRRMAVPSRIIPLDRVIATAARAKGRDRIAILFGSEKRGLGNAELDLCHAIVRIPTSNEIPSMNLGQAVAVCCYELRHWARGRETYTGQSPSRAAAASSGEIIRLADAVAAALGFARESAAGEAKARPSAREIRLRKMLMRWPLTAQDVTVVLGLLRDLTWQLHHRASLGSPPIAPRKTLL